MADKRKLQCDIDRTLKRVQEGRTSFQEILDKFDSSNNQTQKEKFEADLKKEIKRLQRFRDQIKTWHTSNEIKDKRPLQDARRLIEQDMERFKVIEKETKTKAYSKEGLLTADAKKDPLQKEKEELDEWLKQSISVLQTKSEKYEYDMETLTNTGKKKRADKEKAALLDEKRQKLDVCAYHIEKLETVMRHLDNERLECLKVRSLHDPVEYVIEFIDEENMDDYRSIYEDLHLEDLGDSAILASSNAGASGFPDFDAAVTTFIPVSTTKSPSVDDCPPAVPITLSAASSISSNASSRERSTNRDEKYSTAPVATASTSTPVSEKRDRSVKAQLTSSILNQTAPSAFQLGSASSITPRENYAKVAGESKKSKKDQQQPNVDPESDTKTITQTPTSTPIKSEKKRDDNKDRAPSIEPLNLAPLVPPSPEIDTVAPAPAQLTNAIITSSTVPTSMVTSPSTTTTVPAPITIPAFNASEIVPPTTNTATSVEVSSAAASAVAAALTHHQQQQQQQQAAAVMAAVANQQAQLQQQQQCSTSPFVVVHPRDALAPFRNRQLDKQRTLPHELRNQVHGLESAFRRQPLGTDTEKARLTLLKKPANVPSYFPSEPLKGTDTEEYFMKLDAQTLFFLFYFFEGTKVQYLAAKALKRMSWRFHTKHLMWFQRNEEPKQITDEFESGTYIYYDCATMTQRKKEEFIFHYSFLEDKDF